MHLKRIGIIVIVAIFTFCWSLSFTNVHQSFLLTVGIFGVALILHTALRKVDSG